MGYDLGMNQKSARLLLFVLLGSLSVSVMARADDADGEAMLTPNQQRRITQVNHDLPTDLQNQPRDSRKVTELRSRLRQAYDAYRQALKEFGTGTDESRQAGHHVVEVQQELHKQFIQEEAIPAVSQLPQ